MKRKTWCMVTASVLLLLTGCGPVAEAAGETAAGVEALQNTDNAKDTQLRQEQQPGQEQQSNQEQGKQTEAGQSESGQTAAEADADVLIAYFTWAENTKVEHPETIDVDATTSASVLLPGNTAVLANAIRDEVGGDLFSIVVSEPYSSDYDACLERASEELAENARPELTGHVEHMDQYETIFLGFPDWWSTCPMAVFTFLEEYDFSGKTVIPFCAHGTSGVARSIRDIRQAIPEAEIEQELGVYRSDMARAQELVRAWLEEIGMKE